MATDSFIGEALADSPYIETSKALTATFAELRRALEMLQTAQKQTEQALALIEPYRVECQRLTKLVEMYREDNDPPEVLLR